MISVANVFKYFGLTPALKNVSFEIQKGEIVGFLGPNGAGKTTLMRILTSYLPATSGRVSVADYDLGTQALAARQKTGYLPERPALYPEMRVESYLKFAAQLKGVEGRHVARQVDRVIEECQIRDVRRQVIATLSQGYRQRVGIAQAIVHDPEVLILDEPTTGLDPLQIIQVRRLITNLERKRTVILSTHILSEIEQIAKRVLIIKKGEIVADQNLTELLNLDGRAQKLEDVFLELTREEALP